MLPAGRANKLDLPSKLPPHRNSIAEPRPSQLMFYSLCATADTRPATERRMWLSGFLYKAAEQMKLLPIGVMYVSI